MTNGSSSNASADDPPHPAERGDRPPDAPRRTGGARPSRSRDGMLGMRPGLTRAEASPLPYRKVARAAHYAADGEPAIAYQGGGAYGVRSFSDEDTVYYVTLDPALSCDCPDAHYNDNVCKHICLCLIDQDDPEAWAIAQFARILPGE